MPADLLRETAYLEQLGLDRSLYPIYRQIEAVHRRLEDKADTATQAEQLRGAGAELVAIENRWKKDGVWSGELSQGVIPAGQGVLNDLLERAHALEAEVVRRLPDRMDKAPPTRSA
jgi:hypothetical protein